MELSNETKIDLKLYEELQKPFSKKTILNYIGCAAASMGYDGPCAIFFSMFLTFMYTEYLGVGAAQMAVVVSVSIIVDGITDFLMGMVTDRIRTKWGKIRHWFLWTSLPIAVFAGFVWIPPAETSATFKLIYVFIMYNVFCSLVTMVRIPGAATFTLCTDNEKVRGNLIWFVMSFTTLIGLATNWIINPLLNVFGGGVHAYQILGWIFGIISFIALNIGFLLTNETKLKGDWKERDQMFMQVHQREKREGILEQYGYLFRNKWWMILMLSKLFGGVVRGISMGVLAYYLQYVLGDMGWLGLFGTAQVFMMIGVGVSIIFVKLVDARKLMTIVYAIQSVICILAWVFGSSVWIVLVCLYARSFFDGVIQPSNGILIARVVEYGEWKNGIRQEGLCNCGQSVMGRIGTAIATAGMGFVLAAFGYSGAGTVTAACASSISFMYLGVPAICSIITFIIFLFMRLDGDTVEQYKIEIAARKAAVNQQEAS